jgi:CBS domain containing-hemolysin-like protein
LEGLYLAKIKKSRDKIKNWIIIIIFLTFLLAIILSFISETLIIKANIITSLIILVLIISIGVLFDIIGVAITACPEVPVNSMAANKIKGAKEAVGLLKNADRASSFCNDVIGDICGIISGAIGAAIVFRILLNNPNLETALLGALIAGFVSSLTVGGKAIGKNVAIKNCKSIVLKTGYIVHIFSFISRQRKKSRHKN